ncbi:MAG: hypothetical protein DRP34_00650, partial [Thermodesulfobacteriota bacterium]
MENLWQGLREVILGIKQEPEIKPTSTIPSSIPTISSEESKLNWTKTQLFKILPLVLPDFKKLSKEKQIKLTEALAKKPDVFAQVLAINVKDWDKFPVEKKRKIISAIYSPEQIEELEKWPWFDPVFALSAPVGFGIKDIARQAIKAGAKAALKETGRTAAASGASLAAETGMTLVGEPLEEKYPILASILAPLVGAGIGVASEKGIGALAKKFSKPAEVAIEEVKQVPKIKETVKNVGEKTAEEVTEELIEEKSSSPTTPSVQSRMFKKSDLAPDLGKIIEGAKEVETKIEPKIKSKEPKVETEVKSKIKPKIKEPWEMTKEEFLSYYPEKTVEDHKKVIKEAFINQKLVPKKAVKDYPDLLKVYEKRKQEIIESLKKNPALMEEYIEKLPKILGEPIPELEKIKKELKKTPVEVKPESEIAPIYEGEGWTIFPAEKKKFKIAFEDSELGQLVKNALHNQLEEVKAGEPPRLYRVESAQGPIEYYRSKSSFPSWFKNKGWSKERVVSVLEKAIKGEPLTEKQAEIVKEALNSKEVKDYIKTVLSWGGAEVKLYAGLPLDEALQKGFKALNQLTQVAGEKAAEKGFYKLADILGYGKEIKRKDIKGVKTWTAKLYNLEDIVRRYGKDYPEVKEIEYAMKWIREPQANRWAYAVDESIMKPLNKLSKESKERVFKALYKESLTGKPDLSIRKFTPQEFNVYRRIRRFLEIVWKDVKNSYREALDQYINAKPMSAEEKTVLKKALEEAKPELVPDEIKLKHPVFYRHLVRYSEMHPVPFYMPQKRTGNFMVKIIDPETKETIFAHDVETSAEAKKIAEALEKGDYSVVEKWFKELGIPFNLYVFPKNYKVVVEEISRIPVEAGEEIPFSKTIAFLHAAAERAKKLPKEEIANFYVSLAEDLDNFLKSLGWSSHLIRRKNIPGFSLKLEDAEKRLRGYLYGYGLSRAKKQAMEHAYKAFYKLVNRKGYKPAGLIQELSNYLNYAFGTPERKEVQLANRLIVFWYLGGRVKSALINATQNLTTGLAAYIRHKIPKKQLLVGLKKVFYKKAQTLEDRKALRKAVQEGWLDANIVNEMLSQWRGTNTVIDTAMLPFRYVETVINRATHFIGAFDYFHRVKKLPFDEAYKKAIEVMLEGHFWASRYNRAPFERGTWGRLLTALQTFTFHYFRYAFDLANKKEWKALAWLLGSPMVLGGIVAIPGGELVKEHVVEPLYKKLTGRDLEVDLSKHPGIKYGPFGYLSPSLSISVGVGFSEDPMRIYGGVIQSLWNQAKRSYRLWKRGDKWGAIIELMPAALRDVFKAARNKPKLRTTFGEIVLDEKGRPVSLTGKEAFMMALGFKPMKVQKVFDMRTLEREIQKRRNEILRRFGTQLNNAETIEDKKAVLRALIEYDNKVKEKAIEAGRKGDMIYYKYWNLMHITPDEVIRWAE